ncbi:MAG TPA: hypothetical protein VF690_01470, partial [Hymenobacter sp.]
ATAAFPESIRLSMFRFDRISLAIIPEPTPPKKPGVNSYRPGDVEHAGQIIQWSFHILQYISQKRKNWRMNEVPG